MGLRRRFFFALLAAVAVPAALLPSPAAAATWTQVAEAGLGNPGGVIGKECFLDPAAGKVCIGATGRISWIDSGVRTTLVDGLFSETARGGFDVEGPAGLSIGEEEQILAQIGTPPQEVPAPPVLSGETFEFGQAQAGRLIAIKVNGTWRTVARVGEFDFNYTLQFPMAAQEHDANPYGLLADR